MKASALQEWHKSLDETMEVVTMYETIYVKRSLIHVAKAACRLAGVYHEVSEVDADTRALTYKEPENTNQAWNLKTVLEVLEV